MEATHSVVGPLLLTIGILAALGITLPIAMLSLLQRQRPKFSLRWMLLLVFFLSIALYGGVRWWSEQPAVPPPSPPGFRSTGPSGRS